MACESFYGLPQVHAADAIFRRYGKARAAVPGVVPLHRGTDRIAGERQDRGFVPTEPVGGVDESKVLTMIGAVRLANSTVSPSRVIEMGPCHMSSDRACRCSWRPGSATNSQLSMD